MGFHWVLSGFHWVFVGSNGFSLILLEFYEALEDFTGFQSIFMSFLLDFLWFSWLLLGFRGFCVVLNRLNLVLVGFQQVLWMSVNSVVPSWSSFEWPRSVPLTFLLRVFQGEEYEVIDDSQEHWWKVRDKFGSVSVAHSVSSVNVDRTNKHTYRVVFYRVFLFRSLLGLGWVWGRGFDGACPAVGCFSIGGGRRRRRRLIGSYANEAAPPVSVWFGLGFGFGFEFDRYWVSIITSGHVFVCK